MSSDYYELLGLTPAAEAELIDKAYRLLAVRYHPDRATEAEPRLFERIQQAYQVLSDAKQRSLYDRHLLAAAGTADRRAAGCDAYQLLPLRFEQAAFGGPIRVQHVLTTPPQWIDVQIPRAVEEGHRIRLPGMGEPANSTQPTAPAGDLVLIVHVAEHPRFRRRGLDLYTDVNIPLTLATEGGSVQVDTLQQQAELTVPPGTRSGDVLRLRAAGLRNAHGQHGDFYAVVRLQPDDPTAASTATSGRAPLHREHRMLERQRTALRQRIDELDQQTRIADRRRQRLRAFRSGLHRRHRQLDQRQQGLDELRQSLDRRARRLHEDQQQIHHRQQQLQTQRQHLLQYREMLQQKIEQADRRQRELAQQQASLDQGRDELDRHRRELHARAESLDVHERDLADREHTLAEARAALGDQQAEHERRVQQLDAQRAELDRERTADESRRAELRALGFALDRRAADLAERERQVQPIVTALDERRASLDRREAHLTRRADRLRAVRACLGRRLRELESAQATIAAREGELDRLAADLAERRNGLDRQEAQQQRRAAEIADSDRHLIEQRNQLDRQADELNRREQSIERAAERLAADRDELDRREADLQQRLPAPAETDESHARQIAAVRRQRDQLDRRAADLDQRQQDLETAADRLARQQRDHQQQVAALVQRQAELEADRRQLAEARAQLDLARAELRDEREAIDRDRRDVHHARQTLGQDRETIERQQATLSDRDRAIQQAEAEATQRHASLDERQAALNEQQTSLEQQHATLEQRMGRINQRLRELEAREAQLVAREAALNERHEAIAERERALEEKAQAQHRQQERLRVWQKELVQREQRVVGASWSSSASREPASSAPPAAPPAEPAGGYTLVPVSRRPAFSIAPHHVRVACGFSDPGGGRHLFVDAVHASQARPNTWAARLRYYRGADAGWQWVSTPVEPGGEGEADAYGAASPHVVCVRGRLLLFYAGRGPVAGGGEPDILAPPGRDGYLPSRIMLATAPLTPESAPAPPFTRHGVVLEPGAGWDAMRLDHPCAVVDEAGGQLHLFYTGYDSALDLERRKVGHASLSLDQLDDPDHLRFERDPDPVFAMPGGGEMPRIFRHDDRWHMLYQHFDRRDGTRWRLYVSDDLRNWLLIEPRLFDGIRGELGELTAWTDAVGRLTDEMCLLASGPDDDHARKLWSCLLQPRPADAPAPAARAAATV